MEDDEQPPAFSSIRDRFEQLSKAGPSYSSSSQQTSGMRVSSDRLHDRVIPSINLPPPSPLLISAHTASPIRSRAFSNPDSSEAAQFVAELVQQASSTPSSPSQSPKTYKFPPIPPPRPPRPPRPPSLVGSNDFLTPSSIALDSTRQGQMLAYKTSSESLIDDNIPAQSVASLRSKFAALSPTVLTPSRTQPRSPSLPTLHIAEDHSSASAKVHNQRSTLPVIGLTPEAVQDPLLVQVPSLPPRPVQSSSVPATRAWPKESFKPNSPPVLPARKLPPPLPERPSNPSPGDVFASEHQRSDTLTGDRPNEPSDTNTTTGTETLSPETLQPIPSSMLSANSPVHRLPPPVPRRPPTSTTSDPNPQALDFHTSGPLPPPLPTRRNVSAPTADPVPPLLPPRNSLLMNPDTPALPPPLPPHRPASTQHTHYNANGFLPPPTRVIGAQDTLPPARRPPESDGSSSEEEEQEVDGQPYPTPTGPFKKRLEELPDATHSSRRPPHFRPGFEVPLSAHTGAVAVAGNCVCTASHHIRVYDLDTLDSPIYVFDVKDAGLPSPLKDHRVTALAFRPSRDIEDEGRFLWCGTKDGHLFEFDAWSGVFRGARQGVHLGALTHILRYGQSMVTICDQGKALISSALEDGSEFGMTSTSIRSLRLSEKQGFVKIFGNHLWTANGPGNNNAGAATALRGPSLRIYDLTPGNPTPKTLIPSDAVGQVTSGAVIPSRPEYVYIGHEGGCVTIWMRGGERSLEVTPQSDVPVHVGTVKIGTSDVLALEGVRTRLWAGFRNGMILAYDVEPIPWRVTNTWKAHEDCPVLKIDVDPLSIDKCARLTVFSTGRNERVRFWDGLLGVDYVETELLRREARYSLFYDLKILICSWNIDASRPDMLTCNGESVSFLPEVLRSVGDGADAPDIIVFGFQEVIDLESRKLTAKTVLLTSGKKKKEGTLADKVSSQYRLWLDQLSLSIRTAMPLDCPYSVVHFENMVGLLTCVFVKRSERHRIKNSAITTMKRGLGGRYGNKGAIAARFTIDDSSLCFINCHLAAGKSHTRQRNADLIAILEDKSVFPAIALEEDGFAFVGGGDGSMILDHETCFLSGDLNYRIDQRRENVIASIKAGELDYLLQHDQLSKERKNNPAFRLRSFREAPITFPPTYKYDRRSDEFDTSEKRRVPAWCDRILYRCRDPQRVQYLHYRRYEANISDHRPISGGFHITTRLVQPELRDTEKLIVEQEWRILEQELLREAHRFYLREMRL